MIRLLKISSVRFTIYYFISFVAAIDHVFPLNLENVVVALTYWFFFCIGTELFNRCADVEEDKINNPIRTNLCESFGYRRLYVIAHISYLFVLMIGFWCYFSYQEVGILVVTALNIFVGYNYSFGFRYKSKPRFVYIPLLSTVALPYLTGMAVAGHYQLSPAFIFSLVFVLTIVGMKDITDEKGDAEVGYISFFMQFIKSGKLKLILWMSMPYLYMTAHIAITKEYLYIGLMPVSLISYLLFIAIRLAGQGKVDRFVARELMYHSWVFVLIYSYFLELRSLSSFTMFVVSILLWLGASQFTHWYSLTKKDLKGLYEVLFSEKRLMHRN